MKPDVLKEALGRRKQMGPSVEVEIDVEKKPMAEKEGEAQPEKPDEELAPSEDKKEMPMEMMGEEQGEMEQGDMESSDKGMLDEIMMQIGPAEIEKIKKSGGRSLAEKAIFEALKRHGKV